jgi:CRP/FNR family cyclic AMP-dependent transcriptional regulator
MMARMARKAVPVPEAPLLQHFDLHAFLELAGTTRQVRRFQRGSTVFAQGAVANSVFYIQTGGVKLSVLSRTGKEAVVAMLGPGDFFGEGCLAGQSHRIGGAKTLVSTTVMRIAKDEMVRFIEYNGGLKVNSSLLSIVLHD